MGAPPFPVKKRQKLLLFDFLWVKERHKKENCPGAVLFACNVWLRKNFQIRFQTAPPRTSATSMP